MCVCVVCLSVSVSVSVSVQLTPEYIGQLAVVLGKPTVSLADGATTATFKINTADGVKGI